MGKFLPTREWMSREKSLTPGARGSGRRFKISRDETHLIIKISVNVEVT
jgi:hypothetical protein